MIQELIRLWDEFEIETRESRRIKYPMSEENKGMIFKADFHDFMEWLKTNQKLP